MVQFVLVGGVFVFACLCGGGCDGHWAGIGRSCMSDVGCHEEEVDGFHRENEESVEAGPLRCFDGGGVGVQIALEAKKGDVGWFGMFGVDFGKFWNGKRGNDS